MFMYSRKLGTFFSSKHIQQQQQQPQQKLDIYYLKEQYFENYSWKND